MIREQRRYWIHCGDICGWNRKKWYYQETVQGECTGDIRMDTGNCVSRICGGHDDVVMEQEL